jgi:hypothetical protein
MPCMVDYAVAAVNLLILMFSNALKLVYIKLACNAYPPAIRITAFNGLEKVIIKLTCGGARLLPTITKTAIGIQAYNALLYPFHIKNDNVANDNTNTIALSMNLGFPNGVAIIPSAVITTRIIKVAR